MITYAMPRSPRPMTGGPLRAPAPVPVNPALRAQPAPVSPGGVTGRLGRGAPQAQAQGRDVVNQGGQTGVVGRGGNFQPLGAAAMRRMRSPVGGTNSGVVGGDPSATPGGGDDFRKRYLKFMPANPGAGAGTSEMDRPDLAGVIDTFNGRGAGSPSPQAPPGTDIETAIQSLKGQLGMPTDAQVAGAGGAGNGVGANGGFTEHLAASPGGAGGASDEMMQKLGAMPAGGNWQANLQGQGAQNPNQNPYADILRRRMATYGGGAGGAGGGVGALVGGQLAY